MEPGRPAGEQARADQARGLPRETAAAGCAPEGARATEQGSDRINATGAVVPEPARWEGVPATEGGDGDQQCHLASVLAKEFGLYAG